MTCELRENEYWNIKDPRGGNFDFRAISFEDKNNCQQIEKDEWWQNLLLPLKEA